MKKAIAIALVTVMLTTGVVGAGGIVSPNPPSLHNRQWAPIITTLAKGG